MLLVIAFLLFAVLFAGWLTAPSSSPVQSSEPAPVDAATSPETSPA